MHSLLIINILFLAPFVQTLPPRLNIYYPYIQPHRVAEPRLGMMVGQCWSSAGIASVDWSTSGGAYGTAALRCSPSSDLCSWEVRDITLDAGLTTVTIRALDNAGVEVTGTRILEARGFPITHRVDCSRQISGDGSIGNPFNSLYDAVQASYSGDTIQINVGGCTGLEQSYPRHSLTIQGDPELPHAEIIMNAGDFRTETPEPFTFKHLRFTSDRRSPSGIEAMFYSPNYGTVGGVGAQTYLEDVRGAALKGSSWPLYVVRDSHDILLWPGAGGVSLFADVDDSTGLRVRGGPNGGNVDLAIRNSEITEFDLDNHGNWGIQIEDSVIRSGQVLIGQNNETALPLTLVLRDSRIEGTTFRIERFSGLCFSGCMTPIEPLDVLIERNTFADSNVELSITNLSDIASPHGHRFVMQNNVMDRSGLSIELTQNDTTTSGFTRALIRHNTFVGAPAAVRVSGSSDQSTPPDWAIEVANNIIARGDTGISVINESAGLVEAHILGNDFHANRLNLDVDGSAIVEQNIFADPVFAERLTGDYRLRAGSPCIDAGAAISDPPVDDAGGNIRPQDGDGDLMLHPDIGAWEAPAVQPLSRPLVPFGTLPLARPLPPRYRPD